MMTIHRSILLKILIISWLPFQFLEATEADQGFDDCFKPNQTLSPTSSLPTLKPNASEDEQMVYQQLSNLVQKPNQNDAQSQYFLGTFYDKGFIIDKDSKQAVYWYEKSAGQGNKEAQYALGAIYHQGEGVPQNFKNALQYYQKAADQGHASAQYLLGLMYCQGQGVDKNLKKAIEWYQKAASQGHSGAQCNLGVLYKEGQGVDKKDPKQAITLIEKSKISR